MKYNLVRTTRSHLDSLTTLLDNSFGIHSENKLQVVTWKYFHSYLKHQTVSCVALDEQGQVVSHYCNLPVQISRYDHAYKAMICVDMCTSTQHRGQGLISKLSKQVYADVVHNGYDFSLGYSNKNGVKVDKHSKGYGYEIIGKFSVYLKPLFFTSSSAYEFTKVTSFDAQKVPKNNFHLFHLQKDYAYLQWRYVEKPNANYSIYEIQHDQDFVGYVVLHFSQVCCYLFDLILFDYTPQAMQRILAAVESLVWSNRKIVIIMNIVENKYWQEIFRKCHYINARKLSTQRYLTIKTHKQLSEDPDIINSQNWWIVNGDIL